MNISPINKEIEKEIKNLILKKGILGIGHLSDTTTDLSDFLPVNTKPIKTDKEFKKFLDTLKKV